MGNNDDDNDGRDNNDNGDDKMITKMFTKSIIMIRKESYDIIHGNISNEVS